MCKKWHNNTQTRWLMQITGDPLHSRALAHSRAPLLTQPCPHCSHSRAPGEQWARLCVFTLQGCVQAARLCRGSPVQMSFHEIPKKAYYFLWYKCCSCIYVKRAWCIQCCGVDRGRHRCHNSEQLWSAVPWMKHMRTLSETALSSSLQHEIGAWIIDSYPAVMPPQIWIHQEITTCCSFLHYLGTVPDWFRRDPYSIDFDSKWYSKPVVYEAFIVSINRFKFTRYILLNRGVQ